MYCSSCGAENHNRNKFCCGCGAPIEVTVITRIVEPSKEAVQQAYLETNLRLQQETLRIQQQQLIEQQRQNDAMAKCPRCGSTSLAANKKGFGIGKAVIGASIIGPWGLIAGNLGAKKVQVTCLKCKKRFKM